MTENTPKEELARMFEPSFRVVRRGDDDYFIERSVLGGWTPINKHIGCPRSYSSSEAAINDIYRNGTHWIEMFDKDPTMAMVVAVVDYEHLVKG